MLRFFSMVFFLVTSSIIVIITEFKPLNNTSTIDIMNKLPVILIPSSYVFLIWIIIFPFLGIWLIDFWRSRFEHPIKIVVGRTLLFNASLGLHTLSIILWHYEQFNFMMIGFIGLLGTSTALYFSYPKTESGSFTRMPISLYLGWNVFSFMFLSNYMLTLVEWTGWGISQTLWSVIFLTITTAIGLHFLYHYEDFAFNTVLMWGFISIAVKSGFDSLFVSTASLFLTIAIASCYFIFKYGGTHDTSL